MSDLDRAYVVNGDDLRIALGGVDGVRDPRHIAEYILGRIEAAGVAVVTERQLAEALEGFRLSVRHDSGATYTGVPVYPKEYAKDLIDQLSADQAHEADEVVDAHICCEHAGDSDPEVAAMAALAPALAALRRLEHDEALRVMRWATDRATGNLPPF